MMTWTTTMDVENILKTDGLDLGMWPVTAIDWTCAAEELTQDYITIEVDGNTYFYQG